MTEAQVGFLYKLAATTTQLQLDDPTKTLLRSYYLMRCKDLTRGYGLPDKHFSTKTRCPSCCIEWKKDTEIKVHPIKLSKRQKKRLKSRKVKENRKQYIRRKADLLHSNKLEQICTFCKQSQTYPVIKPQKELPQITENHLEQTVSNIEKNIESKTKAEASQKKVTQAKLAKKKEINVYANALDVFSLQNKKNALPTKEKPKVISNNKKKKDKFAGLCQKAVLASAKIKEQKEKQNKLNLFLKPSA